MTTQPLPPASQSSRLRFHSLCTYALNWSTLHKSFEYGTWGGGIRAEFERKPGEIVPPRNIGIQVASQNADLDFLLKRATTSIQGLLK